MPPTLLLSLLANWRIWAAVALAAAGAYLHHMGYVSGRNEVQVAFDAYKAKDLEQAMAAQAAQTTKEQAMQAANLKVKEDYESLKSATAVAVSALDADRLRLQSALAAYRSATGQDSGATARIDDAAAIGVLAECVDSFAAMAATADRESDRLKALQTYVVEVIQK